MAAAPRDVRRARSSAEAGPSASISARARSTGASDASTAAFPAPTVDDPGSPWRELLGIVGRWSAARTTAPPANSKSSRSSAMPLTTRAWPGKLRRKAWQPALVGASNGPGTKKHSRPCSNAQPAVIRAPLRRPASTTTVASDIPLTRRLRRGKAPRVGTVSGSNSEITAPPPATMASARRSWARGNI